MISYINIENEHLSIFYMPVKWSPIPFEKVHEEFERELVCVDILMMQWQIVQQRQVF